jgi:regulator of sigma E protease
MTSAIGFIYSTFYFIITIGILILIHELGHFLAAKLFKMRVDVFSLGFPPRAFGKKIGDTDYCISWLPIGGYVKIAGMIDESFDTEFVNHDPQPYEFRSKPAWQKVLVLSGGVIANILLAIAIFWGIIYVQGKDIRPITDIGYVLPGSMAEQLGLRVHDRVLTINGKEMKEWDDVENTILTEQFSGDVVLEVRRDGNLLRFKIAKGSLADPSKERFGIFPAGIVTAIGTIESGKPAALAGLKAGDIITTLNGDSVHFYQLSSTIKKNAGKKIVLGWVRDGISHQTEMIPSKEGRIGISLELLYQGPLVHKNYSILQAFPAGVKAAWQTTMLLVVNMYQLVTGQVEFSKSVGGPVKIAQMATRSAESGLVSFLGFMGILSMTLAFLNIIPFPALDGGHVVFVLIEGILGREIPVRVKLAVQQVGFVLLLVFMAFVLYNDIVTF